MSSRAAVVPTLLVKGAGAVCFLDMDRVLMPFWRRHCELDCFFECISRAALISRPKQSFAEAGVGPASIGVGVDGFFPEA